MVRYNLGKRSAKRRAVLQKKCKICKGTVKPPVLAGRSRRCTVHFTWILHILYHSLLARLRRLPYNREWYRARRGRAVFTKKQNKRMDGPRMSIFNIFVLLGGLAMFLYGMDVMGKNLEQTAGAACR